MNTKKAVWIGRPGSLKTTLHSFSFETEKPCSVFFTAAEEETIELRRGGDAKSAFMLLHTPSDYVLFAEDRIKLFFSGLETVMPVGTGSQLTMEKHGERLLFREEGKTVLELEKNAFRASASFGIITEGPGSAYIEVF